MRRILVDYARSKGYQKRGGTAIRITLDEMNMAGVEPNRDLVALDDARSTSWRRWMNARAKSSSCGSSAG